MPTMVMQHKQIVYEQPTCSSVAVGKRMDVLKLRVKVRCGSQDGIIRYILYFCKQFLYFLSNIFGSGSDFFFACYIIVKLIFTGALS